MMQVDEKPIRVISFSGKQQDWTMWEEKFLARANKKGYKKLLVGSEKAPKDGETWDARTTEGKEKKRLREANEEAYEDLILSIDGTHPSGRVAFNLVRLAKTLDLADGDAKLAWARLQNKYATKSAPSLMALKKEFTNSRLVDKKGDPDVWIRNLEDLKVKMETQGSKISDVDFMIHILNNLPKEYEVSQAKLEDRLNDEIDPLTIEEIRMELNLKFTRMNPKKSDEDDTEETALYTGGFKGFCYNCGERGHKKQNCPKTESQHKFSQNGATCNFKMKCTYCGKRGHTDDVCWFKHGKPEKANLGAESAELLLHAVDHVKNMKTDKYRANLQRQKNIWFKHKTTNKKSVAATTKKSITENTWIADSGATSHMTNDDCHMFDIHEIDEEITIGNGKPMKATQIGSIRLATSQEHGKPQNFTMTNVKYVPELYCKLFSLTAAIDRGLMIGNEGRIITLKKGNFKIAFDKIIQKKTGFVSAIELIPRTVGTIKEALKAGRERKMIGQTEESHQLKDSETGREMAYVMFPTYEGKFRTYEDKKAKQRDNSRKYRMKEITYKKGIPVNHRVMKNNKGFQNTYLNGRFIEKNRRIHAWHMDRQLSKFKMRHIDNKKDDDNPVDQFANRKGVGE